MSSTEAPASGPASSREVVLDHYRSHVNSGLAKLARLADLPLEVRSEGSLVFDEQGTAFLDCGGYSVFLLGHRHPDVVAAVKAQLEIHPLATRLLLSPELGRASARLAECTPAGLDYVFFTNSGAEATEAGIKLARLAGKTRIISTIGGFHGKTIGALSATGREQYRESFDPLLPNVEFVKYGEAEEVRRALTTDGDHCCVILEPVQGENGVVIPPDGYLRDVRRLCDSAGALLILDEVQTGLGRIGSWWGANREQIVPDILLAGKALGGGVMPVGAAVTNASIFRKLNSDPLLHTSTFGGNPMAMAAVEAAIGVTERDDIVARSRTLGEQVLQELRKIVDETCPDMVAGVRGIGLLIGIEFHEEYIATAFMIELLHRKIISSNSLNTARVIRLTPPAVMTDAECAWLFEAVRATAETMRQRYGTA